MSDFQNSLVVVPNSWERLQYQLFSMGCILRRRKQVRRIESQCRRGEYFRGCKLHIIENARPHQRPESYII